MAHVLRLFGYLFGLNIAAAMILMTTINGRIVKKVGSCHDAGAAPKLFNYWRSGAYLSRALDLGLWGIVPFVMLFIGTISTIGSNSMGLRSVVIQTWRARLHRLREH